MSVIELKGMTWDHPRGLVSLVASNDFDLMVIDHPLAGFLMLL